MRSTGAASSENRYKALPSIDELLRTKAAVELLALVGTAHLTTLARGIVDSLRSEILSGTTFSTDDLLPTVEQRLTLAAGMENRVAVHRVINATGVILHTNLGRAPLSDQARKAASETAAGYCTLEYDLETGTRGKRGGYAESLIAELTGAEAAIIVNNCAAAAFLVLSVFARGGEVIVSRGEMVEIGGDFRVPDVLTQSGAALREVGTTNRTKLADYEEAIGDETRMLLRVHPSNYRIVGFTAMPNVSELSAVARKYGIVFFEDIGSGALIDLSKYGLNDEPVVADSIRDGADLVAFSGDKLLGGPQSGIIAGRRELIEKIREHPLYRVLRVDKIAYAGLAATLAAYRRESALNEVPVLRMLALTKAELAARTAKFAKRFRKKLGPASSLKFEISDGFSAVGGGSAPLVRPETVLLAMMHERISADGLAASMRNAIPPVIARIEDDKLLLDLRTVAESEEDELIDVLASIA